MQVPIKGAYIWTIGTKRGEKKNSSEDTCTPCFGVAFHSLFVKFSKQNPRPTCACTQTPSPLLGPPLADLNLELHKNTFSGPAFTLERFSRRWLADCTCSNMCSGWATLPVNRLPTAQTENMHSSLRVAAWNHWLACVCTHMRARTYTHFLFKEFCFFSYLATCSSVKDIYKKKVSSNFHPSIHIEGTLIHTHERQLKRRLRYKPICRPRDVLIITTGSNQVAQTNVENPPFCVWVRLNQNTNNRARPWPPCRPLWSGLSIRSHHWMWASFTAWRVCTVNRVISRMPHRQFF